MLIQNSTTSKQRRVFFFNDTATTEIYILSLHDALPISLFEAPTYAARGLPCSMRRRIRSATRTPFSSEDNSWLPANKSWLSASKNMGLNEGFMDRDASPHFSSGGGEPEAKSDKRPFSGLPVRWWVIACRATLSKSSNG